MQSSLLCRPRAQSHAGPISPREESCDPTPGAADTLTCVERVSWRRNNGARRSSSRQLPSVFGSRRSATYQVGPHDASEHDAQQPRVRQAAQRGDPLPGGQALTWARSGRAPPPTHLSSWHKGVNYIKCITWLNILKRKSAKNRLQ